MENNLLNIISQITPTETKTAEIMDASYTCLIHYDDDLLFFGTNENSDYVIGSLACECPEIDSIIKFHSVVSINNLNKFFNREITLFDLMSSASNIWIVKLDWTTLKNTFYSIKLNDIPKEFLPLESLSFYPEFCKNIQL